jgi:predicted ArsR family transcriptional regulator
VETTNVHRALADERRAQIVGELDREPAGLDAHELARRLGLHANTVRWHLGILADAGIVSSHPGARTAPGRPRIVYALRGEADAGERENYRLLATILTGTLAELDDGSARATEAGRVWGRYLVRRSPPHIRLSDTEAKQEVVDLLAEQGFRPEAGEAEIRMHRCPFRDLAETGPSIVCAVHRGLISGALAELGSALEVAQLDAFVEPELCIARLRRNG